MSWIVKEQFWFFQRLIPDTFISQFVVNNMKYFLAHSSSSTKQNDSMFDQQLDCDEL